MKSEAAISLSIAALSLVIFFPNNIRALSKDDSPDAKSAGLTVGQSEAAQMVRADARLVKSIDARKVKQGQQIKAILSNKVLLKNGPELPRGTELIGTVAADEMHENGNSRLALRFTKAELKNGKAVPIKATIVSVYDTTSPESSDPNTWTPHSIQIEQEDAFSGVDMHSEIAGRDSGVFVSTKKDDVKLPMGYGIALAIEARPDSEQNGSGSNGGA